MIDVGVSAQELLNDLRLAALSGHVQRRGAIRFFGVRIGAALQKQGREIGVTIRRRDVQRRLPVLQSSLDRGAFA